MIKWQGRLIEEEYNAFSFWLSVVISGIVSIAGFALTKITTTSFDPTGDNFVGGNGNPGLMFVMLPMLIILYFSSQWCLFLKRYMNVFQ